MFSAKPMLTKHLAAHGDNRCLLLTDGMANVGCTEPDQLAAYGADLRASGVTTTTFGMGEQFDDEPLSPVVAAAAVPGEASAVGGQLLTLELSGG